ncbi:MAG TPA: imidazole glycerol phosphate synthase subunit HisH [Opitutales bacterium]|nr:imidazole glycerol phosphate synthase subunit HisH [Opitutales bacterium]
MSKGPKLAIIDYGMGNLRSVLRGWEAAGANASIVQNPKDIAGADALVFPGQGAIVDCMRLLTTTGFDNSIREWVAADKPFFGICLGLQALFESSEEGDCPCLGIFPGRVLRFRLPPEFKVPHMGWNNVAFNSGVAISEGLEGRQFYFVHSYYAAPADESIIWGRTGYGGITFTSAVARGRCHATQFHPEKSQAVGLQLYNRFLTLI